MSAKIDTSARTRWIGTSWKMNKTLTQSLEFADVLLRSLPEITPLIQPFIIPPFTAVRQVKAALAATRVKVGAQNMHWHDHGAWTGEVSPPMLKDCDLDLVEIGHSERRTHFGETDETVARKVAAALKHDLLALVCIGDSREQYEKGETAAALAHQTRMALSLVGRHAVGKVIMAYEPVWSIGEGGVAADPDFANAQHRQIKLLSAEIAGEALPVLYGGSVNLENCADLAGRSHIDGLFIGRAAWNVDGYLAIIDKVHKRIGSTS